MRARMFFAILSCFFLVVTTAPVAYSFTASDYGNDFGSLPLKVQGAVKSSQGRVSVGVLTFAGPRVQFGNGLAIGGNYVLVPSALIPFHPELAYGKTTLYAFNDTPASFVYGSLRFGLAVLELAAPLPGAKPAEFADSIEVGKKYNGATLLVQGGKSLNVSLVSDSLGSGMLLPEKLPESVIGTPLWDEGGKIVGLIAALPEGIAVVQFGAIRQFLEGFKEWLRARPGEKKVRPSAEDQKIIEEKAAAFTEVLELYATKSFVKPDNIAACAEEMLQMKKDEGKSCRDRYSAWHPEKEYEEDVAPDSEGRFGGVGLEISQRDGKVVVISPIDGTPGFRAAVKSGDVITKVDGNPVSDVADAVKRMRGKPGTAVELTVEREGKEMVLKIVREVITIHAVSAKTLGGGLSEKIGYLKVKTFSEVLPGEFRKEMLAFQRSGITKVVLDFRYNPGGRLNDALEILYGFARPGDILIVMRERHKSTVYDAAYVKDLLELYREPGEFRDMKVVVLVNKGSASASEIFSGTMKDWGYSIVGPPCSNDNDNGGPCRSTFGKGVGQTVFPLSDGSVLRLTTFEFLVGNSKTRINEIGVVPTLEVVSPTPSVAEILREDRQLEKAIEILIK